ncbi:MAG: 16S rRNA (guanine(966)-N(2))-methyltransferase RsmD [Acidimicrobiales bacterium]
MRVVSGLAKGRRLVTPKGRDTSPTSDRVREAIFNALGSLDAVEGARVLDLFAGSGALGVEALSRGAAHATFVEKDDRAVASIWGNLVTTGFGEQASVTVNDAMTWLARRPGSGPFDLALADPPYAFADWGRLLDELAGLSVAIAVLESDRQIDPGANWQVVRVKRYGSTVVTIIRRRSSDPEE